MARQGGVSRTLSHLRQSAKVTKNSKLQISNNKQITMTDPPAADQTGFMFWSLDIGICNVFVIWCLGFVIS
jgi:hypothetical protein